MNRQRIVMKMLNEYQDTHGASMAIDGMFNALEETGHRWSYKTLRDVLDSLEREGWVSRQDHPVSAFRNIPMATQYRAWTKWYED